MPGFPHRCTRSRNLHLRHYARRREPARYGSFPAQNPLRLNFHRDLQEASHSYRRYSLHQHLQTHTGTSDDQSLMSLRRQLLA